MLDQLLKEGASVIGNARLRGCQATRVEFERMARRVDFSAALPASAILIVRSLRCRSTRPRLAADDARAIQTMERNAGEALAGIAARAARPRHGAMSGHADAVCFEIGELVECLAREC